MAKSMGLGLCPHCAPLTSGAELRELQLERWLVKSMVDPDFFESSDDATSSRLSPAASGGSRTQRRQNTEP